MCRPGAGRGAADCHAGIYALGSAFHEYFISMHIIYIYIYIYIYDLGGVGRGQDGGHVGPGAVTAGVDGPHPEVVRLVALRRFTVQCKIYINIRA